MPAFWRAFALWIVAVGAVAVFGGLFRPDAGFAALAKPTWNPPAVVFGPVWTLLYLLMAIAAAQVAAFVAPIPERRHALTLMGAQLVLNGAWSALFFGAHRIDIALADIALLWVLILFTTLAFWRLRTSAALLMLPYIAWVSFAAALNFAIYRLN